MMNTHNIFKGIQTTASLGKQQEYYNAVRKSEGTDSSLRRTDLTKIMQLGEDDEVEFLNNDEPGFDLTGDEINKFKIWRGGVIPYYIDVVSFNDKALRDQIRAVLVWINSRTALSFQELPAPPEDSDTRWVIFSNRRGQLGCSDHSTHNFTNKGVQLVHMGYDCIRGDLAEALLLLAGIPAQHNAPDRDKYIKVIEENIIPEKRYLFKKLNDTEWLFHDLKYDFTSASHFDTHRHSKNGRATIEIQVNYDDNIGSQSKMTKTDIEKLRMLYNYMVKKTMRKSPECKKLFKKNRNFYNLVDTADKLKPRKKSYKYLGNAAPNNPDPESDKETDYFMDPLPVESVNIDDETNKTNGRNKLQKKKKKEKLFYLESDFMTN
ncbi:hypothetical protein HF086_004396 [Spodoptera exigua]|uniref:Metalloendopeptidase n=1 Tax=Spodoptera exigua TaxID=7107 RepID=A0A922SEA1_SPOEX|nr:hypothetical protein HF086_004396 [Spodoptera exigua]